MEFEKMEGRWVTMLIDRGVTWFGKEQEDLGLPRQSRDAKQGLHMKIDPA